MRIRRRLLLIACLAAIAGLAGCSVPPAHGVRLNSDGTIDFVDCYGTGEVISVDFSIVEGASSSPEWEATSSTGGEDGAIIRYGEAPPGYRTTVLEDPPTDWISVDFGMYPWERSDLVVGEWEWVGGQSWPWVPPHPCEGVDVEDLDR